MLLDPQIWYFLEGAPTSYLLKLPVSFLSAGPQSFSPFPSPNNRSPLLLPLPVHFPSLVSPSLVELLGVNPGYCLYVRAPSFLPSAFLDHQLTSCFLLFSLCVGLFKLLFFLLPFSFYPSPFCHVTGECAMRLQTAGLSGCFFPDASLP